MEADDLKEVAAGASRSASQPQRRGTRGMRGEKWMALVAAVFVAVSFSSAHRDLSPEDLQVSTMAGRLQGTVRLNGGAEFLGVPYAQPPVGELRWREPLEVKRWGGVRDATHFGAPCAQNPEGEWNKRDAAAGMEDCLYLNVITPSWPPKKQLPVMFWIHGGGNTGGTASSKLYKDGSLVSHGVVLVTVNYRLGVFGFLAHPELTKESLRHASGNYGLMDQLAALHWVRANISKFGGDPSNITVFGQSAGAEDTSLLMASSLAKGYFQKAIAQSGSAMIGRVPTLKEAEPMGVNLAGTLKAPINGSAIAYMRGLTTDQILHAVPKPNEDDSNQFGPIVDGYVLTRNPADTFAAGQQAGVPMIIGTTTKEFPWEGTSDDARRMIRKVAGPSADQALAVYGLSGDAEPKRDPLYGTGGDQWAADLFFRCPAISQAMWQANTHHAVYQYEFQHATPGHEKEGAIHSTDLAFVFGYYPSTGNLAGPYTNLDNDIASTIETYWTNFAKKGNPNSFGVPEWPEYSDGEGYIEITQAGKVVQKSQLRKKQCELYRQIVKEHATTAH